MRTITRAGFICAASAALLTQSVHVSWAGPLVDRGHDRIDVEYVWEDFCGTGLTMDGRFVGVENGSFHLSKDGFPLFTSTLNGTNTITAADGRSAVIKFAGPVKDQSAADNGDGTFTLTTAYNGLASEVIAPDGHTVAKDTGRAYEVAIVDYNGTPSDPDDDEILSVEFVDKTGSHPIYESGLCVPLREAFGL